MPSATIREQIIEELRSRMANFTWETFSPTVFVGVSTFDPDADPLPVLTILARPEDSEETRYGTDRMTMPVDISALVSLDSGQNPGEHGEPIFGEMRSAAFSQEGRELPIGDDKFVLSYGGGGIVEYPEELGPTVITVGLTLSVTYETYTGDPYN